MPTAEAVKILDNVNKQDSYYRVFKPYGIKLWLIILFDAIFYAGLAYVAVEKYNFLLDNPNFAIYMGVMMAMPGFVLLLYIFSQKRFLEVRGDLLLIWKSKKNKDLEILKSEIENISINYNIEPNKYSGAKTNAYTKMYGDNMPAYITMSIKLYDSRVLNFRIREDIASYFRQELKEFNYPLEEIIKNKRP